MNAFQSPSSHPEWVRSSVEALVLVRTLAWDFVAGYCGAPFSTPDGAHISESCRVQMPLSCGGDALQQRQRNTRSGQGHPLRARVSAGARGFFAGDHHA